MDISDYLKLYSSWCVTYSVDRGPQFGGTGRNRDMNFGLEGEYSIHLDLCEL